MESNKLNNLSLFFPYETFRIWYPACDDSRALITVGSTYTLSNHTNNEKILFTKQNINQKIVLNYHEFTEASDTKTVILEQWFLK